MTGDRGVFCSSIHRRLSLRGPFRVLVSIYVGNGISLRTRDHLDDDGKMALSLRRLVIASLTQGGIWFLISFNYYHHMIRRPVAWNSAVVIGGHAILALFVMSWCNVMFTPALEPPAEWHDAGKPGGEECKKTSVTMPPRAYNFKGRVVLGFDHYCGWLGTTVGLHNRKFFVLLLLHGSALCNFAGALAAVDYHAAVTSDEPADGDESTVQGLLMFISPAYLLMSLCTGFGSLAAGASIDAFMAVVDGVVGVALLLFGLFHVRLVLRNCTTIEPNTIRWDVGRRANWCQVFGENPAWWLVPLPSRRTVDGVCYPLNPKVVELENAAATAAAATPTAVSVTAAAAHENR